MGGKRGSAGKASATISARGGEKGALAPGIPGQVLVLGVWPWVSHCTCFSQVHDDNNKSNLCTHTPTATRPTVLVVWEAVVCRADIGLGREPTAHHALCSTS